MKKAILNILALTVILMAVGFVAATHTSTVEISPSGWLKPNTEYEFTFSVNNEEGDSIKEVIIDIPLGFSNLNCGDAPTDWNLYIDNGDTCGYKTTTDFITAENSEDFTLKARASPSFGDKPWLVATKDVGEVTEINNPTSTVQTIQNAIDETPEGGTVEVPAGTYDENVVINKDGLHLVGAGSDSTIIAPVSGRSIEIWASDLGNIDDVSIEGFTLESVVGQITLIAVSGGGGLPASSAYTTNLAITDVIINGRDGSNHGIGLNSVDGVTLTNVQVNNVGEGVKAIELTGVRNLVLTDSLFEDNDVAVRVQGGFDDTLGYGPNGPITITNSRFSNNRLAVESSDTLITINAENNWWGVITYEEIDDLTEGLVDYDPWCYDAECSADTTDPEVGVITVPAYVKASESFNLEVTVTDDRDLASYFIDFGDGTNATGEFAGAHDLEATITKTHGYSDEGKYTMTVTVTDSAEHSSTDATMIVVTNEDPDWVIELSAESMNLISIPFTPEDTNYEKVFGGIKENLDRFWAYVYDEETKSNKWKYKYYDGSWDGSTGFSNIVPGYGYIVFMKNDDVLYGDARTISGDPDSEPELPASVKLANGYNLIGLFGTEEESVSIALSSLEFGGTKYWHKVLDVNEQEVTTLQPEKGYWLSMLHVPGSVTEDYYTYYP